VLSTKPKIFQKIMLVTSLRSPCTKRHSKNLIYPVPGQHGWTKTDSPDIDPPEYETKRGRKQKKRRRGQHESSKSTVQNRMTTIQCSNCKLHGHRYTNCVQPLKPHLAIRKAQHKVILLQLLLMVLKCLHFDNYGMFAKFDMLCRL
jgi:hypothetical protein